MSNVPFHLKHHHVGYFVSNIDTTVKWYEEMFGFELAHKTVYDLPGQGPTQMCWIQNGDFWIELYQYDPALAPFTVEDYLGKLGCKHVCFYVANDEFDALRNHLKEKGANVFVDIRWPNDQSGALVEPMAADSDKDISTGVIYVADPDGMWIEVQGEFYPGVGARKEQ